MKKKIIVLTSIVLVTSILSLFLCIYYYRTEEVLAVVANTADFGKVNYFDTVRVETIVKNIGDKPIMISHILTTCNCSMAKARKHKLEKGDSTIVDITYHAVDEGYVEKRMPVHFINTTETVDILLKGRVKPINSQ
ncbi:MAG: DUF1573 domain-containing protein [Dysgonamonadaceae bacterium]|jgi:hypothetical protein|nr:DUF1573 domain-containing protein [Dysgonamonadaceae bacterium]